MSKTLNLIAYTLLLTTRATFPAIFLPISDQELVDQAPEVVTGMILGTLDQPCQLMGIPCTANRVVVTQGLKGSLGKGDIIHLRTPGGPFSSGGQTYYYDFPASPTLLRGRETILFLQPYEDGFQLVQFALGAFIETPDRASSRRLAIQDIGKSDRFTSDQNGSRTVRDFDLFAQAISEQTYLTPSTYSTAAHPESLSQALPKGGRQCPKLPVFVTHRWHLSGEIDGYAFDEMQTAINHSLDIWNGDIPELDMHFFGNTAAPWYEMLDNISHIMVDPIGLMSEFKGSGTATISAVLSVCVPDEGIRLISDGFVWFARGAGTWLRTLPEFHSPLTAIEEALVHELGWGLMTNYPCGNFAEVSCEGDSRVGGTIERSFSEEPTASPRLERCEVSTANRCFAEDQLNLGADWRALDSSHLMDAPDTGADMVGAFPKANGDTQAATTGGIGVSSGQVSLHLSAGMAVNGKTIINSNGEWVGSLPPQQEFWVPAAFNSLYLNACQTTCSQNDLVSAANSNGFVCKDDEGDLGISVFHQNVGGENRQYCGTAPFYDLLGQCHCINI